MSDSIFLLEVATSSLINNRTNKQCTTSVRKPTVLYDPSKPPQEERNSYAVAIGAKVVIVNNDDNTLNGVDGTVIGRKHNRYEVWVASQERLIVLLRKQITVIDPNDAPDENTVRRKRQEHRQQMSAHPTTRSRFEWVKDADEALLATIVRQLIQEPTLLTTSPTRWPWIVISQLLTSGGCSASADSCYSRFVSNAEDVIPKVINDLEARGFAVNGFAWTEKGSKMDTHVDDDDSDGDDDDDDDDDDFDGAEKKAKDKQKKRKTTREADRQFVLRLVEVLDADVGDLTYDNIASALHRMDRTKYQSKALRLWCIAIRSILSKLFHWRVFTSTALKQEHRNAPCHVLEPWITIADDHYSAQMNALEWKVVNSPSVVGFERVFVGYGYYSKQNVGLVISVDVLDTLRKMASDMAKQKSIIGGLFFGWEGRSTRHDQLEEIFSNLRAQGWNDEKQPLTIITPNGTRLLGNRADSDSYKKITLLLKNPMITVTVLHDYNKRLGIFEEISCSFGAKDKHLSSALEDSTFDYLDLTTKMSELKTQEVKRAKTYETISIANALLLYDDDVNEILASAVEVNADDDDNGPARKKKNAPTLSAHPPPPPAPPAATSVVLPPVVAPAMATATVQPKLPPPPPPSAVPPPVCPTAVFDPDSFLVRFPSPSSCDLSFMDSPPLPAHSHAFFAPASVTPPLPPMSVTHVTSPLRVGPAFSSIISQQEGINFQLPDWVRDLLP